MKKVAFIIPHKGREEMLLQTLASIAAQDFDLNEVEVLVVSQNKTAIATDYFSASLPHIDTLLCDESLTISALRNLGEKQTDSEYIAFLDADVELSNNWLNAMLERLNEQPGRVLVSAIQRCEESAPVLEQLRTALSNAVTDCNVRFLPGRNLFLRRQSFEQIGGFPEHLQTCEDYFFTDQANELGKLYYTSSADYVHLGEDKRLDEMFKKEIWRGQSNLLSLKGRRIPLEELPSFLVPLWILLFTLTSFAGLLAGGLSLFITGLVLALLPVVIYSYRLHKITQQRFAFLDIFKFYSVYFPARIIGTLKGLRAFFQGAV